MAVNGQVVIRPMMYLALSYDHRIVDGKEAVTFLVRLKEGLEDPQRALLDLVSHERRCHRDWRQPGDWAGRQPSSLRSWDLPWW